MIGISHYRLSELERGTSRTTANPTKPTPPLVRRIAGAYGLPADALLELAGYAREHPELSADDQVLLDRFRAMDHHHRAIVLDVVAAISARSRDSSD